jgi:hypothetical protein
MMFLTDSEILGNRCNARPIGSPTRPVKFNIRLVRSPRPAFREPVIDLVVMLSGRFVTPGGRLVPKLFQRIRVNPKLDRVDASVTARSFPDGAAGREPASCFEAVGSSCSSPGVTRTELLRRSSLRT